MRDEGKICLKMEQTNEDFQREELFSIKSFEILSFLYFDFLFFFFLFLFFAFQGHTFSTWKFPG